MWCIQQTLLGLLSRLLTSEVSRAQAKDSLAACTAELAAARNASSGRRELENPSLPAGWAAVRNASAGALGSAGGSGSPAGLAAQRNASDAGGGDVSGNPTPEGSSGLSAQAAGAAASAAQAARDGAEAAGDALQDARQAAAGAAATVKDGAVGAAAGAHFVVAFSMICSIKACLK